MDVYAAEFVRLSCFAPTLVAEEEKRVHLFQQGLRHKIKEHLTTQAYKTYSEIFEAACRIEKALREVK